MEIADNSISTYAARVAEFPRTQYSPKSAEGKELHDIFYNVYNISKRVSSEEESQCEDVLNTIISKVPGGFV
jgi:hypothetical protein